MAKKWQRYIYLVLHNIDHRFQCRNASTARFSADKGKIAAQKAALFDWLQQRAQVRDGSADERKKNARQKKLTPLRSAFGSRGAELGSMCKRWALFVCAEWRRQGQAKMR